MAAGSLGKGGGDAFSDVDLLVLAQDGKLGELASCVVAGLAQIAKPVLVNQLFGGRVISVVTDEWERFDISLDGARAKASTRYRDRRRRRAAAVDAKTGGKGVRLR